MKNDWEGEDRRARERWKVKKEISLPDIISFLSAALAVVFAYTTLDKRTARPDQATRGDLYQLLSFIKDGRSGSWIFLPLGVHLGRWLNIRDDFSRAARLPGLEEHRVSFSIHTALHSAKPNLDRRLLSGSILDRSVTECDCFRAGAIESLFIVVHDLAHG